MNDQPDTTTALDDYGAGLAERLGGEAVVEFDTVRIYVDRAAWVETLRRARDEEGLTFFSWLSGIDWSKDVEVGDTVAEPDELEERFEVMCRLSSMVNADGAQFIATLPKDDAVIDSITGLFGGAGWHERETHDMFGIEFIGNPNLSPIYLPEGFIGHPLLKSYPLLAREMKPWPGDVDVEDMPEVVDEGKDA
ncbi:MAG: NADH-quinone oxidoreductase subunit C [Actinomycetota bacterium]|nr:NADH-quinone oxidoreductase subunit C [Actinomycetota bacterium]